MFATFVPRHAVNGNTNINNQKNYSEENQQISSDKPGSIHGNMPLTTTQVPQNDGVSLYYNLILPSVEECPCRKFKGGLHVFRLSNFDANDWQQDR